MSKQKTERPQKILRQTLEEEEEDSIFIEIIFISHCHDISNAMTQEKSTITKHISVVG
jgi:hypothetical protein